MCSECPALAKVFLSRRNLCRKCPTPCTPRPSHLVLENKCPLAVPRWEAVDVKNLPKEGGLGDAVESMVKPIATALHFRCLDKDGNLKPDSGCAGRRARLNAAGRKAAEFVKKILPHA